MPSAGTTVLGTSAIVAILIAAGAGTSALDVTDQLEAALNDTVDSAMRDMAVGWLEVTDAQGRIDNGTVVEAEVLVRPDGTADSIHLDDLVVARDPHGLVNLTTPEVLSDQDGTVDDGIINDDDLVRLSIHLEPGLDARETTTLSMHEPRAAPLEISLAAPRSLSGRTRRSPPASTGDTRQRPCGLPGRLRGERSYHKAALHPLGEPCMMSPGGSTVVGSVFLVLTLTGAAAGVHAVDLGARLDEAIDDAVDRTLRDLTVGWLEVTDARGHVEDGTVREIDLVVRLDGAARQLDTHDLTTVTVGAANATLTDVEALQDADGSLDDGIVTSDDLVRLTFMLDAPLDSQETIAFELQEEGKAPLIVAITTPVTLSEPYATLETNVGW